MLEGAPASRYTSLHVLLPAAAFLVVTQAAAFLASSPRWECEDLVSSLKPASRITPGVWMGLARRVDREYRVTGVDI